MLEANPNAMKTTLIVLFILCAAAALGQTAGSISGQAQMMQIADHPQHASQHALAQEQPIVGGSGVDTYSFAQGERPLWEFGPVSQEPSLGDVARAYRKEKVAAKKAAIVVEKQGS
jgi:hypothetical protein